MAGRDLLKKLSFQITHLPYKRTYKKITAFIKRRPLGSFFLTLGLLLFVIILGRIFNTPKQNPTPPPVAKHVHIFSIGQAPKATFEAKIEKAGVIKIIAQTSGIVQSVNVTDGDTVTKGEQLVSLSTNYEGDNAPAIQSQIAQTQYQNVLDTFDKQKDAIQKQRDIANITHDNFADQQAIASQSASNTSSLIDNNQTLLDSLNQQLTSAQNSGNQQTATGLQAQISQLQSGQNQLKQALSNLQEQTDSGKPPGRLADTQRDLTLEQLDIQEKSLELNKEVTQLQSELAAVNEDTMNPASPVDGVVERVFVHQGDSVSQGTQLAIITATSGNPQTIALADVPQQIAQNASRLEPSDVFLNGNVYELKPFYISSEATDGLLYSIFYIIPTDETSLVTDSQYVSVAIPVGSPNTGATVPFVPIDAVYQTQDENYLLVDRNNTAEIRKVSIGNMFGNYIEITEGLKSGDLVIEDRNVIAGDKVTTN